MTKDGNLYYAMMRLANDARERGLHQLSAVYGQSGMRIFEGIASKCKLARPGVKKITGWKCAK